MSALTSTADIRLRRHYSAAMGRIPCMGSMPGSWNSGHDWIKATAAGSRKSYCSRMSRKSTRRVRQKDRGFHGPQASPFRPRRCKTHCNGSSKTAQASFSRTNPPFSKGSSAAGNTDPARSSVLGWSHTPAEKRWPLDRRFSAQVRGRFLRLCHTASIAYRL